VTFSTKLYNPLRICPVCSNNVVEECMDCKVAIEQRPA